MTANRTANAPLLVLSAHTAADLMNANPVSIDHDATVREAPALFNNRGFSVAPVIDDAGRPIGVLSSSDILVHDQERTEHLAMGRGVENAPVETDAGERLRFGFHVENVDKTLVSDLMTPAVFSVAPDTPAAKVVSDMLRLHVHHLFVVDAERTLIGVISSLDVLRKLTFA
ncbi:MAG: CBS domain-containing protein [Planctomycetes bacterium]|nr:CBS domain-containing protein [Planctomycetota bacterium]